MTNIFAKTISDWKNEPFGICEKFIKETLLF